MPSPRARLWDCLLIVYRYTSHPLRPPRRLGAIHFSVSSVTVPVYPMPLPQRPGGIHRLLIVYRRTSPPKPGTNPPLTVLFAHSVAVYPHHGRARPRGVGGVDAPGGGGVPGRGARPGQVQRVRAVPRHGRATYTVLTTRRAPVCHVVDNAVSTGTLCGGCRGDINWYTMWWRRRRAQGSHTLCGG